MKRVLFALALIVTTTGAQTPPPVTQMVMSPQASRFLDSLANDAREHRVENGACVTSYAVRDSVLWLDALGPATYARADSITIWTDTAAKYPGICPPGLPSIHSHVIRGGSTPPSDTDKRTAQLRGMWNLLLSVRMNGWLIFVY